jgi:UDP-N-acetylenolpyruvoylglucosamine reductase
VADLGLSGIEFGEAIQGTIGGAMRMNANAYDCKLANVVTWVEVYRAGSRRATHRR